jgi:hypothetical protein
VDDDLIGVHEGAVQPDREALDPRAVAPLIERIERLRGNRDARVELAARALSGALAGLVPLVDAIADDCQHEAIDVAATRRTAATSFGRELAALRDELASGTFLRHEALAQWQAYVGADEITRLFSHGISRVRAAIGAILRPVRAPIAEVQHATADDLIALARMHAAEAARRTATAWSDVPAVSGSLAENPDLWDVSDGFDERLRERIEDWIRGIGADIQAAGASKRLLARGAALGVNAVGTGVMLATFIHTAGLTGTELGIAAATAFVNQKLLSALFGEAAMVELVQRSRARLGELLAESFGEEEQRFEALVPRDDDLSSLAASFRSLADELRGAPAGTAVVPGAVDLGDEPASRAVPEKVRVTEP